MANMPFPCIMTMGPTAAGRGPWSSYMQLHVASNTYLGLVMGAKDGGHEVGQGVVAEVRGHVADLQPLPGRQRHCWGVR